MRQIFKLLVVILWISNTVEANSSYSPENNQSISYKRYVDSMRKSGTYMPYFPDYYRIKEKPPKTYIQLVTESYNNSAITKTVVFLLIGFISLIILITISIPVNRYYFDYTEKKSQKLRLEYLDELIRYIFDDDYIINKEFFSKIIKLRFNRKILLEEIIKLHSQFIGVYGYKLEKLFFEIGLDAYSLDKVRSKFWYIKARGFREVAEMCINSALPEVENNLDSKNIILKVESRIAWTKLNPQFPVKYLENETVSLTEWGKMHVFGFLIKQIVDIDPYLKLLDHKNPSIIIFGLQTVGLFKRYEYTERISGFLTNANEDICAAAIISLGNMGTVETSKILIEHYDTQTPANKTTIVQIVSDNPCDGCVDFFAKIIEEGYINRSLSAVKGLLMMKDFGEAKLNELLESNIENLQGFINQIKESNIE